nr:hypothetical protein NG677_04275 [Methylobacterium sp. OTU13CASTA1]
MSRATRKGAIVGAFVAHPLELRRSPAWRALPDDARRVLMRLELEHMEHGGACNGALACTYTDFADDGLRRSSVSLAIRQCVALGFLEVTQAGRRSISDFRRPSLYRLTYLNGCGASPEATHDWRHLGTDEDAKAALGKATAPPPMKARRAAAP